MILPNILLVLGILLIGLSVYLAVSAIVESLSTANNSPLTWASGDAPQKSKSGVIRLARPLVHRLVIPILSRYEMKTKKEKIKREIQAAGLSQELNENEYIGLQYFLGVFFPLLLTTLNLFFDLGYPWIAIVAFALFGFAYPYLYVKGIKDERRTQIVVDLPFVVDLLALSTEAGLDFIGSISKVVEKMTGGALAEELNQILRDLKLGSSRSEALNAMAWRLNMSEVSSFIAVLVTADAMGASIGGVLRQQSEQMRQERFTRAEKAGAQASQKIFIPLVIFILPAVLLMVFGPVIIQFMGN
ncbi:MAG: type II secretion system F family protein [Oligoflexia bacterium]|nr:type II secretion system F family protein [Oligoflexia bacterium]